MDVDAAMHMDAAVDHSHAHASIRCFVVLLISFPIVSLLNPVTSFEKEQPPA